MALRIGLTQGGRPLRLGAGKQPGTITLVGEGDAPGRRTTVQLFPLDELARRSRVDGDLPRMTWALDDGRLVVESAPPRVLRGHYDLLLGVDGLAIARNRRRLVKMGTESEGAIALDAVPQRIALTRPVSAFDPDIRTVVGGAQVDGRPAATWLEDQDPALQAKRKACLLNLLAVLRSVAFSAGPPPVSHVLDLLHLTIDHLSARASAGLYRAMYEESQQPDDPRRPKVFADFGIHPSHRDAITRLAQEHGDPAPETFESFRIEGRPSMQIVFGIPGGAATTHLVDIDLDLGNPRQDLLGLFIHFGELYDEGIDHIELRDRLAKGPAGPFLYYTAA